MEGDKALVNGQRDDCSSSPGEKAPCLPPASPDHLTSSSAEDEVDIKQRHKRSGFLSRVERRGRKWTGLSRIGLIVVLILVALCLSLFIAVVSMAATWPVVPHWRTAPVCDTPACLEASAQIMSALHTGKLPCNDFVSFACQKMLDTPIPAERSRWSQTDEIAVKYRELVRSLIVRLPHISRNPVEKKIKYFYESCMDLEIVESDSDRQLKKIIRDLGGWYVLRDFEIDSFDYRKVLQKVQSEYGVFPFFKVAVVPDGRNPEKNILQISPAELGLPDASFYDRISTNQFVSPHLLPRRNLDRLCLDLSNATSLQTVLKLIGSLNVVVAYKQFLKDVTQLLGAASDDANTFSDDMFYFERRLSELLADAARMEDPIAKYNRMSIEKLKRTASFIPLLDILQALYPKANIDEKTDVIVTSASFLDKLSNLLSTVDKRALNNYIMWRLTAEYLPYLTSRFRKVHNIYEMEIMGIVEPMERWEMCVAMMEKYMGFALASMVQKSLVKSAIDVTNQEINNIFNRTLSAIRSSITTSSYPTQLKKHCMEKINSMALAVGFPPPVLNNSFIADYYSKLHIVKKDLLQNIQNAKEFILKTQEKQIIQPSEEQRWIHTMASDLRATYIPIVNKVVVPLKLLLPPYFNSLYPKPILYGRIGMQLAQSMVYSILTPSGVFFSAGGTLLFPHNLEVNQSLSITNQLRRTIVSAFLRDKLASHVVANQTALDALVILSALKKCIVALNEELLKEHHLHQPALEVYEGDQLFFITFAQTLCSVSTEQQENIYRTMGTSLNSSDILYGVLKQLSEFTVAFSCPSDSLYYNHNSHLEVL